MRKILILGSLAILAIAPLAVEALDDIALPTDGSFYDGAIIAGRANAATTTDPTTIKPRRIGDILVGGAGSGTNAIWVSKGLTTNDWVLAGLGTDMATVATDRDAAITAAITAQADTNAVTVTTVYTPRQVGDILLGFKGAGTNACWIAAAAGTNGWVNLK
jgi:hypothetical protein